jgi:CheY-like chemotaxis protein
MTAKRKIYPSPDDRLNSTGQAGSETEFVRRTNPPVTGRVLAMDDDQTILEAITLVLATVGVEVVTAENGQDAMRCFHSARSGGKPFNLVILDMVIPRGQGGAETLRQIRMVDTAVKVIVSTGYAHEPEIFHSQQYGFDGCLPKPYRGADLLRIAFTHLPRK